MNTGTTEFRRWLIELRNDFHQHPELSGAETRTTATIADLLRGLGASVTTFDDTTGAVGLFRGRGSGTGAATIALRADIDALPVHELSANPNRSRTDGVMHACGHDANTAIVLGVARKIADSGILDRIGGSVKCIFQPAEERLGGAKAMIARGVLEDPHVDRVIAGHMDPGLPVGTVGVFDRIGHAASDPFHLTITGKGAHGARPHEGINPISVGSRFVAGIETIIPRAIPAAHAAVISVGAFHAGKAGNVIPATAEMGGSIRTHDADDRQRIFAAMKGLCRGLEAEYGATCDLAFDDGAPLGLNDPDVCRSLMDASARVLGEANVKTMPPIMGSEDFYFFAQKRPGAIMRFGCASEKDGIHHPLHSPYFDIHEDVLEIGTNVLFQAVVDFFEAGENT